MKGLAFISGWDKHSDGSGKYGLASYSYDTGDGMPRLKCRVYPEKLFGFSYYDDEKSLLYVLEEVNENDSFRNGGGGKIYVFKVDPDTGQMDEIDCRATWSPSPCYLSIDKSKSFLIVTHHGSQNAVTKIERNENGVFYPVIVYDDMAIELFTLEGDGKIGKLTDVVKCTGNGPEKRQFHAHPHTVTMSPQGSFFAVCDKGNDTVSMYKIVTEAGKTPRLELCGTPYQHRPGTLPRYCAFSPDGKWFFHNTEIDSRIFCFACDESGNLELKETVEALLETTKAENQKGIIEQQGFVLNKKSDILYSVVRGVDAVSVMKFDSMSGHLQTIQNRKVTGAWPRGCALSPDEKKLFVCCRDSGEVIVFDVETDGKLGENEKHFENPSASFVTLI